MLLKLLRHLLIPLLEDPSNLSIDHLDTPEVDVFLISVAQGDRGHVLGREGKTADAVRGLVKRAAETVDRDVVIDILD